MTTLDHPNVRAIDVSTRELVCPIDEVLGQIAAVLEGLSDEQYTQRPVGPVESSIGAHLRHCLDHVRELIAAAETGAADFDARRRDTDVQRWRQAGLEEVRALRARLMALPEGAADRPLRLTVLMTSDGAPMEVGSSFGREAAFVLSHTIHHNALIGAMVKTLGGTLPPRFGYAPSTVRAEAARRQ